MHRGDIGLELVKQERSAHQLSSSDLIGCGSSSTAIADGKLIFRIFLNSSFDFEIIQKNMTFKWLSNDQIFNCFLASEATQWENLQIILIIPFS